MTLITGAFRRPGIRETLPLVHIADNFNRFSSTGLGNTSTGNIPWTVNLSQAAAGWGTNGTAFYTIAGGNGVAGVDCGTGDGICSITIPAGPNLPDGPTFLAGIIGRTDVSQIAANTFTDRIQFRVTNHAGSQNAVQLQVAGNGGANTLYTSTTPPTFPCELKLACQGLFLEAYVNGVSVFFGNVGLNMPSTTKHAFGFELFASNTADPNSLVDDFDFKSPW